MIEHNDPGAPDMARINADADRLVYGGEGKISRDEAMTMAIRQDRQRRELAGVRGELRMPVVDGDAEYAKQLHEALSTKPEEHTWSLPPASNAEDDVQAAAEATAAWRPAAIALDIDPGTAQFLAERVTKELMKVHAMDDATHTAYVRDGFNRLVDRYGNEATAKKWVADAVAALKSANADERLVTTFLLGAGSDWYAIELLAGRYRAKQSG